MIEGAADRIGATYLLACPDGEDPREKARDVAWEQTVELPPGSVSPGVETRAVGRVETLREVDGGRWRAVISYPHEACGDELAQLLNLLWGNISLKPGILLEKLELPERILDALGGPSFGIAGIRRVCGVPERPLFCAALKPLGSSPTELAATARDLALGGADLIKDDHSLAGQPWAPFRERVRRCVEAVDEANARTGGDTVYVPNVTSSPERIEERIAGALDEGCRGVLLNAIPAGLPTLRSTADRGDVFVLAHPSLSGGFFGADHGMMPELLLGTLFRVAGADGVIYPNVGGRFPFDEDTCRSINQRLRGPLGDLRSAFPVPGGGIDVERIPYWTKAYGTDTVFLVGASLYARPDLVEATRKLMDELERHPASGDEEER